MLFVLVAFFAFDVWITGDNGCHGGDTTVAYAYLESHGLEADSSYVYTSGLNGTVGACAYDGSKVVAKIGGFSYATPPCTDACAHQDESALRASLYAAGPASVCVDSTAWQNYVSGVLTWASGCTPDYNNLDHCVQLVGYGIDRDSGLRFWSVRNSWADSWSAASPRNTHTLAMLQAAAQGNRVHGWSVMKKSARARRCADVGRVDSPLSVCVCACACPGAKMDTFVSLREIILAALQILPRKCISPISSSKQLRLQLRLRPQRLASPPALGPAECASHCPACDV